MSRLDLPGRPAPTTFELIEVVALREPHRLAVMDHDRLWTYQDVYHALIGLSRFLGRLGVRRGDRVAVSHPEFCAQLLLLIAAENLGASNVAFTAGADADAPTLIQIVDWVLSDQWLDCPPGVRFHLLDRHPTQAEAIDPRQGLECPRVVLALDEPQRLLRTSGSTGRAKFMLVTRLAMEHWIRRDAEKDGLTAASRMLVSGPLILNAVFSRSSACLRLGAVVVCLPGSALAGVNLTHLLALPVRLEELLRELPAGFHATGPVFLSMIGGLVAPALRERSLRVFGGPLANRYGANETSSICDDLDAQGVGLLSPGVDLRIVDERGDDVPAGTAGIIVVRTPAMAQEYVGDPQASGAAFRNGWFHSGDWGVLIGPRRLRLAGRHDDLLTIGGLKVPATSIENAIRQAPMVRDCAVLAISPVGSGATLGIALVPDPAADPQLVLESLQPLLPFGAGTVVSVMLVEALPQTHNGKLDRIALARLFGSLPSAQTL